MSEPKVVYESPSTLIINKPSGLLTHPRNEHDKRESVASWLAKNYPGAVWAHRLDKDTSGILLIAKTPEALAYYRELFHDRKIQKQYIALVYGTMKNETGIIDAPLFKFGTRQSMRPPREGNTLERAALTEYKVVKQFDDYAIMEVRPKTGRTHQIRIHLRSIGHPIVCDPIYAEKSRVCPVELGRLFLHAQKLIFTTPEGQAMTLEADLPPELENFLKTL
ncbi:MAG: RluA family pseudouridine synthase [Patescibacteria group bacterium]